MSYPAARCGTLKSRGKSRHLHPCSRTTPLPRDVPALHSPPFLVSKPCRTVPARAVSGQRRTCRGRAILSLHLPQQDRLKTVPGACGHCAGCPGDGGAGQGEKGSLPGHAAPFCSSRDGGKGRQHPEGSVCRQGQCNLPVSQQAPGTECVTAPGECMSALRCCDPKGDM